MLAEVPVLPLAPAGGLAALGFAILLGTLLASGMLKVWEETFGTWMQHLANWVDVKVFHTRPFHGVAQLIRAADHQVRNAFGWLVLKGENASAWLFSQAGTMFWWTVHETANLAEDVLFWGTKTTTSTIPWAIRTSERGTLARLRGIDQTIGRIEALARAQLKRLRVGIDRLGHSIRTTLAHDIAGVRSRIGRVERAERTTRKDLARVKTKLGAAAFTAAVALALTKIMGRWVRCPSLHRIGRKVGCRGFAALEEFLLPTFTALAVLDLCRFAVATQRLAKLIVPQLGAVLLVQNAVCLGGGASLPSASDRPRVTTKITLPSAHD